LLNPCRTSKQVYLLCKGFVILNPEKKKKLGLKAPKRAFRLYFFVFLFVFLFVGSGSPCYTRLARFIGGQIYCYRWTNLLL
ncbi:hypothetical protein, partial [Neisseria gonorrhoeae]|uniref:hypothetical protein n=1 Tax=Neisseria gonorrhoeae TaxID=485 RepID=UPI001E584C8D